MKIMFSLKVIIKVTFPWKKKLYYDNSFDLNYAPPLWLPISLSPHVDFLPIG